MSDCPSRLSADNVCHTLDSAVNPLLVVISGPSGVGKDAVLTQMRLKGRPYHFVVTMTTRPIRPGEREGEDYIFTTPEEFLRRVEQGEMLEWANVYGNYYGVPRDQVRAALARGEDVIVRTDIQGAAHIRSLAPEAVLIFLAPPSMAELERRLRTRKTDSPEAIERRVRAAYGEMQAVPQFDYVVVNRDDQLSQTVGCIEAILLAEKCRVHPRRVQL